MTTTTRWYHDLAYFLGGAFLVNFVPHFVSGVLGNAFQSPFATPPGEGLSSSTVNVLWGFANLLVAYALLARCGQFNVLSWRHVLLCAAGMLSMALPLARHFGHLHGGLL